MIIASSHDAPQDVLHPGLVLSEGLEQRLAVDATGAGAPQDITADNAISMVASAADRSLTVLRGAQTVLTGGIRVQDPSVPLGNVVYVLQNAGGTPRWSAIAYEGGRAAGTAQSALSRIIVDPATNAQIAGLVRPGSTLLVTDLPAHPGTRSDADFVILTHKAMS